MKPMHPNEYRERNQEEQRFVKGLQQHQARREDLYKSVFLTDDGKKVIEDLVARCRYYDTPTSTEEAFLLAGARNVIDSILLATRGEPIIPFTLGATE